MGPRHPRRKLIVSGLQYRLLGGNFLYLLSLVVLFTIAGLAPLVVALDNPRLPGPVRDTIARQLLSIQAATWIAAPLLILLCVMHSVIVSHRIAGPLYRFKKTFARLSGGDFSTRVRIRRADYLVDEAACINAMIESVARRATAIHGARREVDDALREVLDAVGRRDLREAEVCCGRLATVLEQLSARIDAFRVTPGAREPDGAAREPAPTGG